MTAWQYGFLYLVLTNQRDAGPVFIAQDRTGARILRDCRSHISAANALGARGWIIDGQGGQLSTPDWMMEMAAEVEGFSPTTGTYSYFMRRPSGGEQAPD